MRILVVEDTEDLADAISGVRHVQNNLRLREPGGTMAI